MVSVKCEALGSDWGVKFIWKYLVYPFRVCDDGNDESRGI